MSAKITDLIARRDAICYALIEAEGLENYTLNRELEQIEELINKLGANDAGRSSRTIQIDEANC